MEWDEDHNPKSKLPNSLLPVVLNFDAVSNNQKSSTRTEQKCESPLRNNSRKSSTKFRLQLGPLSELFEIDSPLSTPSSCKEDLHCPNSCGGCMQWPAAQCTTELFTVSIEDIARVYHATAGIFESDLLRSMRLPVAYGSSNTFHCCVILLDGVNSHRLSRKLCLKKPRVPWFYDCSVLQNITGILKNFFYIIQPRAGLKI